MKKATKYKDIYGSMRAIYSIFYAFKLSINEKRRPLNYLMGLIFPYLENMSMNMFKKMDQDFMTISLVNLKIFHCSIYLKIENYISPTTFKAWMIILKKSWDCNQGLNDLPVPRNWNDMFKIESIPTFKLKLEVMKILVRITQFISNKSKKYQDLIDPFCKILPVFIESSMDYLTYIIKQEFNCAYSNDLVTEIFKLFFYSIQIHYKFPFMNENLLKVILYDIAIYHMQVTRYEQDYFTQDHIGYIYSEKNPRLEPVMKSKKAASDILLILIKYSDDFLKAHLDFSMNAMKGVNIRNKKNVDDRFREGVLYGIESTIEFIKKELNKEIDMFLENIILPGLLSNNPFLMARACSIISKLTNCEINNMNVVMSISEQICKGIQSENLFLRIKSVNALSIMVSIQDTKKHFKNDLKIILDTIFDLIKLISFDDLIDSLRSIVEEFQEEIKPFSKELISQLLETFWGIVNNNNQIKDVRDVDDI